MGTALVPQLSPRGCSMKLTDKAVTALRCALASANAPRATTAPPASTSAYAPAPRAPASVGCSATAVADDSTSSRSTGRPSIWRAARKQIGELQAKRRLGFDPAADRRGGQALAFQTMGAVLPAYLAYKRAMVRPRSFVELQRHLMKHYAPLHRHPLSSITMPMVAAVGTAIAKDSGSTTAKNAWRSLHAFMAWALRQGLIERNPAVGVSTRRTASASGCSPRPRSGRYGRPPRAG